MKAKINNIDIEGTPEEIAKFKLLLDQQTQQYKQPTYYQPTYIGTPVYPYKGNEIVCSKESNTFTML